MSEEATTLVESWQGDTDERPEAQARIYPYTPHFVEIRRRLEERETQEQLARMARENDFQSPRTLTSEQDYAQDVKRFFKEVFAEPNMTLADSAGARIIICWRIIKTMAREMQYANQGDTLEDILLGDDSVNSPWTSPIDPRQRFSPRLRLNPFYSILVKKLDKGKHEGLPLAPPEDRDLLDIWLSYFLHLAKRKGIPNTPPEAEQGTYGLRGLQEPELVHLCFPPLSHILQFEEQTIEDAAGQLTARGARGLHSWLKSKYCFDADECVDMQRMAENRIRATTSQDPSVHKAVLAARLEEIAADSIDHRVKLGCAKALMVVHGIARDESSDMMEDLIDSMRRVAREDEQELIDYEDQEP